MPLVSLIKESNQEAIYIGQKGNIEERICKANQIPFIGYSKYKSRIRSGIKGYFYLKKTLKDFKIDALITSGGFVSLSACLYAIRYKIPIFLLEENIITGTFNTYMYPFCKLKFLAYNKEKLRKKEIVSGLPLRNYEKKALKEIYDVLIIGGSLGSKVLCDLAYSISKKYKTCLIAGKYKKEVMENSNLKVIEFSNDIYDLMEKSKVIIARAGASTTAEIFYINKPFICIPSMKTKKNHQYYNAKYFSEKNACILCLEKDSKENIIRHINTILENEQFKVNMLSAQRKLIELNSKKIILKKIGEVIK